MTSRLYPVYALLSLPFALFAAPLQVPSSSGGIIDKEIEVQYETKPISPEKEMPVVEVEIPEEELSKPAAQKVFIKKIEIEGNQIFSKEDFSEIIDSYENRELTVENMYSLCLKIQAKYAKTGYFLVRVYLPEQAIRLGILEVRVLEAKLGAIEVVGNKYYKSEFIASYLVPFLGKNLNYNDLLKALLLLNENTDLQVASIFEKGKELGTVDMILKAQDKAPRHFSADYNTYGSNVTSLERSGLRGDLGNFFCQGDTLSLIGACGFPLNRLKFVDGIYKVPLNRRGAYLEFSYLYSDFDVAQYQGLHLNGKTEVAAAKFIQALQRKAKFNTDIYTGFEYKQIENFEQHRVSAFDKLRVLSLGYKIDYMDSFGGRNLADLVAYGGIPDFLGGLSPVDGLCSRKDAGGRFVYIDANYQRIQKLPASCFLFLNLQGQFSFYKLPLSEEFYIGGINTVRGYPLAVSLGDTGLCVNLEFRAPPPFPKRKIPHSKKTWQEVLQFVGFIDHGETFEYGNAINDQSNRAFLTSVGVGAKIYAPWNFDCSMDVGFPLTDLQYTEQYGRKQKAIFYFKIGVKFI